MPHRRLWGPPSSCVCAWAWRLRRLRSRNRPLRPSSAGASAFLRPAHRQQPRPRLWVRPFFCACAWASRLPLHQKRSLQPFSWWGAFSAPASRRVPPRRWSLLERKIRCFARAQPAPRCFRCQSPCLRCGNAARIRGGQRAWFARGVRPSDSLWAAQSGAGVLSHASLPVALSGRLARRTARNARAHRRPPIERSGYEPCDSRCNTVSNAARRNALPNRPIGAPVGPRPERFVAVPEAVGRRGDGGVACVPGPASMLGVRTTLDTCACVRTPHRLQHRRSWHPPRADLAIFGWRCPRPGSPSPMLPM